MPPVGFASFSSPDFSEQGAFSADVWRRMEKYCPKAASGLLQAVAANGHYASVKSAFDAGLALSTPSEVVPRMNWVAAMSISPAAFVPDSPKDDAFALQVQWVSAVKTVPGGADEVHEGFRRSLLGAMSPIASKIFLAAGADPLAFSAPSTGDTSKPVPAYNAVGREIQRTSFSVDALAALIGRDRYDFPPAAILTRPNMGVAVTLDAIEYAAWLGREDVADSLHRLLAPGVTAPLEALGRSALAILLQEGEYRNIPLNIPSGTHIGGMVISMAHVALRYIGFGASFSLDDWARLAAVRLNFGGVTDVPLAHALLADPSNDHRFSHGFYERAVLSIVVDGGFDVNAKSSISTLLHRCASLGLSDLTQKLLELGADPCLEVDLTGPAGRAPMSARAVALNRHHYGVVQVIDAWSARRRIESVLDERVDIQLA